MDDYVSKPVRPEELQRALEAAVAQAPTPHATTAASVVSTPLPAAVDVQVLANLRELQEPGEPEFVVELIDHFLGETPIRLASIGQAIAAGNAEGLNRLAHSLKSSCGNRGAMLMSSICATLQQAGADATLEHAGTALQGGLRGVRARHPPRCWPNAVPTAPPTTPSRNRSLSQYGSSCGQWAAASSRPCAIVASTRSGRV